jgi:peptidoglycan/xylan/chitin deacetylase (PgdA/CDA1 family)
MAPSALQRVVKASAAAADLVLPHRRGVVVLLYHRVGGRTASEVDLPRDLFEAQLDVLAASGRVTTLDACLEALASPRPPEPAGRVDPVAITFDDGTADFVDVALPLLERRGLPVTLYVATAFVDEGRPFPGDGVPMSWTALRDARSTGLVTVGSHTHGHALLDRLPAGEVAGELDRSRALIEQELGVAPEHFAYPKALPGSAAADAAVRARFRSAALAGTRANPYGRTDPHRLARSPIQRADGMGWFGRKLAGGMGLEDRLRTLANRRRYAGAVT